MSHGVTTGVKQTPLRYHPAAAAMKCGLQDSGVMAPDDEASEEDVPRSARRSPEELPPPQKMSSKQSRNYCSAEPVGHSTKVALVPVLAPKSYQ